MTREVLVLVILRAVVEVIFWGLLLKCKPLSKVSASDFVLQLPFVTKEMDGSLEPGPVWLEGKRVLRAQRRGWHCPLFSTLVACNHYPKAVSGCQDIPYLLLQDLASNTRSCLAYQSQVGRHTRLPINLALPSPKAQPTIPSSLTSFPLTLLLIPPSFLPPLLFLHLPVSPPCPSSSVGRQRVALGVAGVTSGATPPLPASHLLPTPTAGTSGQRELQQIGGVLRPNPSAYLGPFPKLTSESAAKMKQRRGPTGVVICAVKGELSTLSLGRRVNVRQLPFMSYTVCGPNECPTTYTRVSNTVSNLSMQLGQ